MIKRNKGMVLRLLKVAYNKEEVYLVLEIRNRSEIDFKIDYLNISGVQGNKKRKTSYQSLKQEVVYKHDMPNVVENDKSNRFAYVLPKFVLGDDEKLQINLRELKGNRSVILKN